MIVIFCRKVAADERKVAAEKSEEAVNGEQRGKQLLTRTWITSVLHLRFFYFTHALPGHYVIFCVGESSIPFYAFGGKWGLSII